MQLGWECIGMQLANEIECNNSFNKNTNNIVAIKVYQLKAFPHLFTKNNCQGYLNKTEITPSIMHDCFDT